MNKVILLGRLGKDPEVRYTQAAEPLAVCRFSIAVDRPYKKDRQEGEQTCDFINCVSFGKRGESIGQYFHKGNRIAVTGRIQVSSYNDQQGNKKYSTDVIVEYFEFCENKSESGNIGYASKNVGSDPIPKPPEGFSDYDTDEDIPF